jgi:drug/metabolite transporter (DMT)-like permease
MTKNMKNMKNNIQETYSSKWQAGFMLGFLSVIWGSSFILIKKGLLAFTPLQVGSLRIVIAGLVFLPYLLMTLKKIPLHKLKYILVFALLEVGLPPYLYSIAQTVVDSSTAGILNSLVPLFTLLTGILFFNTVFNLSRFTGVLIGLVGAVLLMFTRASLGGGGGFELDFSNVYGLLIVLATVMYGFGGNIYKNHFQDLPSVCIASVSFVSMSIPAGIYLFTTDVFSKNYSDPHTLKSFLGIAALSIIGSALAIYLFGKVIQKSDALFASFVTYFIPFVALLWGYLDGEPFNIMQPLCLLFILSGIFLANKPASRKNPVES